ncbi:MAG: hypothetical protein AAF563_20165 [Pseudomonadota bacterium]
MDKRALNLDDIIGDPDFYADAIKKIFNKKNERNQAFMEAQDGVSYIGTFILHRGLSRALAKTVSKGEYRFSPVNLWSLRLGNKTRQAHRSKFTDQIVGSVVYRVVSNNAQVMGMPGLYSYLPGTSNYAAMRDFARYVRDHRRDRKDPRQRGLFVLQSDFEKYGDNLPVHPDAYIWTVLRDVLGIDGNDDISDTAWSLVEDLVRPTVRDSDGFDFTRLYGIPMGVPIVPIVNNLAASPLDELFSQWDGAFYARFNDDFLFAHPDRSVLSEADEKVEELLEPLGVRRNRKKNILSYFNGAGRQCLTDPQFRGCSRIDFLGLSVSFDGTIGPGPKRIARLMTEVCKRLDRTGRVLDGLPLDDRTRHLVNVTNNMLAPDHVLSVLSVKGILRDTTDRNCLRQIDHRIAMKLVQVATGRTGARGFRQLPTRMLRQRYGLTSLVQRRNAM